jgi:hypothetical protein
MRGFGGSIVIGTWVVLVAGIVVITTPERTSASSPLSPVPRTEFPATSALEIRNDSFVERSMPEIREAAVDRAAIETDAMMLCGPQPPSPEQMKAFFGPTDAASVENASGLVADEMSIGN